MNTPQHTKKPDTGAVSGREKRLVRFFFPQCWDCKKSMMPWNSKGIDGQSHRACHTKRCMELMRDNPSQIDFVKKEMRELNELY